MRFPSPLSLKLLFFGESLEMLYGDVPSASTGNKTPKKNPQYKCCCCHIFSLSFFLTFYFPPFGA